MKQRTFPSELCYLLSIVLLSVLMYRMGLTIRPPFPASMRQNI